MTFNSLFNPGEVVKYNDALYTVEKVVGVCELRRQRFFYDVRFGNIYETSVPESEIEKDLTEEALHKALIVNIPYSLGDIAELVGANVLRIQPMLNSLTRKGKMINTGYPPNNKYYKVRTV